MTKRKLTLANNPLLSGPAMRDREVSGVPYREIPVGSIERDANQPRVNFDEEKLNELTESIKVYGVLTPILVRPAKVPGKYQLIAGERRLRASRAAGLKSVPAIVSTEDDSSGERTLAIQLVENLQRADLSPLERAHAIGALKETYNLSVRDVGERLGISKSMVQRSLDILELPADLLNALREGAAESKILLLAKIEDETVRASYLKDLDVLTRSKLQENLEKQKSEGGKGRELSPEDRRISDEIQRSLGLKVIMARSAADANAGKLTIEFYSESDLQEIFRKLVA